MLLKLLPLWERVSHPRFHHDILMFQRHPVQNEALMLITTNTHHKQKIFQHGPNAREAIDCLYRVQTLHPFFLHGFVIMPDHCHLLMYVPEPETISRIMKSFKGGLGYDLGIKNLWQSRFHLKIPDNGPAVLSYIHNNPLKAGLVNSPEEYPWSSASGKWDVTPLRWN